MQRMLFSTVILAAVSLAMPCALFAANAPNWVQLRAHDKFERSRIVNMGVNVESVASDSVYAVVSDKVLARLRTSGVPILETFKVKSPISATDFPTDDSRFHNYERMTQALDQLVSAHSDIMRKFSIGKSVQGRDLWCVELNTSRNALHATAEMISAKPGVVYMGNHHAREHVSAEIPLMLLEYLAKNYGVDRDITAMVEKRDIYVIPMVNPDGVEYDIQTGSYRWQRKNMAANGTDQPGVDLNRNYGYMWGTGGSDKDPSSEIYMGPKPFSEPETQAIKAFVEGHPNIKTLLTYHTFSELILYPWGHSFDAVPNERDRNTFETMGKKMAEWNHYTPESASSLYIASGDTVDWAYGALGIFAFTFELSPRDQFQGGFYPGAGVLDKVFEDNLKPALYLMDLADDPHRALSMRDEDLDWLK